MQDWQPGRPTNVGYERTSRQFIQAAGTTQGTTAACRRRHAGTLRGRSTAGGDAFRWVATAATTRTDPRTTTAPSSSTSSAGSPPFLARAPTRPQSLTGAHAVAVQGGAAAACPRPPGHDAPPGRSPGWLSLPHPHASPRSAHLAHAIDMLLERGLGMVWSIGTRATTTII